MIEWCVGRIVTAASSLFGALFPERPAFLWPASPTLRHRKSASVKTFGPSKPSRKNTISLSPEARNIRQAAAAAGWTVTPTKTGHWHLEPPKGKK